MKQNVHALVNTTNNNKKLLINPNTGDNEQKCARFNVPADIKRETSLNCTGPGIQHQIKPTACARRYDPFLYV